MSIEAIKTQLEVLGSLKVEFTPEGDEGNSIIVPINDDYYGTFFTVIGCGDKQDNLGAYMALAVNELPDLISEIDRLQRENGALREDRYKLACAIIGGEDAPGLLDSTPTSEIVEIAQHAHRMHQDDIARAMAAELEVERLQTELALSKPLYSRRRIEARVKSLEEALKPFADLAPSYDPPEDDDDHKCWHAESTPTLGDLRRARTALASTGGEHHADK